MEGKFKVDSLLLIFEKFPINFIEEHKVFYVVQQVDSTFE